ncbi:MAG: alpha-L-fucosidase [Candidatus Omnitrophica bacterium]|nr:alpha-L-fucosidase [Candidatus Omnitrophota bacterium]
MSVNKTKEPAYRRTEHPDAQWFGNAGLGLFLHWGISSVKGEGNLSWDMMDPLPGSLQKTLDIHGPQGPSSVTTPAEYFAEAANFRADKYNPLTWLTAAKKAGFTYAVLTTKHHDGFALWPSAYGDFNTRNYLGGRDLVREFVEACRATGLKIGFYYSPPDWYYQRHHMSFRYGGKVKSPDLPDLGLHHEPITLPVLTPAEQKAWDDKYRAYLRGQIEELLTGYGKIDILWFDSVIWSDVGSGVITNERVRDWQPGIVINPRNGEGDYETPEGIFPAQRPSGWWELCHVWNEGGWSYRSHEIYKPTGWVTSELARVRAWGGNFLLNMGPDSHGELPPVAYQRMKELAGWMAQSRESVEGTTSGPWPEQCNVPVTCRDSAWYLHVSWVWDQPVVLSGIKAPKAVLLLRTGEAWPYDFADGTLRFKIPLHRLTLLGQVVKVVW